MVTSVGWNQKTFHDHPKQFCICIYHPWWHCLLNKCKRTQKVNVSGTHAHSHAPHDDHGMIVNTPLSTKNLTSVSEASCPDVSLSISILTNKEWSPGACIICVILMDIYHPWWNCLLNKCKRTQKVNVGGTWTHSHAHHDDHVLLHPHVLMMSIQVHDC